MEKVQIIAPYKHNSNYCYKWETGVIVELHFASQLQPVGASILWCNTAIWWSLWSIAY